MFVSKPVDSLFKGLICFSLLIASGQAFAQSVVPPVMCPEAGECVAPEPLAPPPPPTPPPGSQPTPGACAVQPTLNLAIVPGGPFTDCGYSDATRIPNPTKMRHGLQEMNGQTACITSDFVPANWAFPNLPDLRIMNNDMIYHNAGTFPGDVTFTGRNVVFTNVQNGRIRGNVICGLGASNVEYDGSCICP